MTCGAGGYWCFVGGGVELGETQAEALVRECREEVGLEVEPVKKVYECLSFNKEWILHCWEARLLSHEICVNPREVADWSWMRPHEIAIMPKVLPSVVDLLVDCGAL